MKQKLFTLLTLLLVGISGAWATDYYTPTADEVIILTANMDNDGGDGKGTSTHEAFSYGGKVTGVSSKKAGDPSNNGAATSSNVSCHQVKGGNTTNKQLTVTISGCSKLIVYHESHATRRFKADIAPSEGDESSEYSSFSTYYTEIDLDGTLSYSIVFHGYDNSDSNQDFCIYALKLIKYVAKTIDTQGLKSDNAVKVNGTALTKDALTNGYSISETTITLTADQVAYSTPSNIKLVNHITYTDTSTEDKDVAASFDGTVTEGYYIGTATVAGTDYTVRVPKGTEAISAVSINGSAISSSDLTTLQSDHAVSIDGSGLNGIGLISVTLNSGAATVTRTNSGNNAVFTFTCNSTEHTVTVTNVKKTYTALNAAVYYSKNGKNIPGAGTKTVTANTGVAFAYPSKTFDYGAATVTVGSDAFAPLKLSTGEATTVTFPTGFVATKVKVYGWSVGGNGKMYAIQETSDASGKKVDADQLATDIYYATNTAQDIYPSVYEYDLDNWSSMYFNAGGSASQPFIVMDFELVDTRTATGAHTLTWTPNTNTSETSIGTQLKTTTGSGLPLANMGDLGNQGSLAIEGSAKSDLTSKIAAPTAYDADKYMYVTFKVASGYRFTPTSISAKIQPVSGAGDAKLVLTDGNNTIEKTQASITKGSTETVTETNSEGKSFGGEVTLKIYCYGSSTGTYRLGSPITIVGTIATIAEPSDPTIEGETITLNTTANMDGWRSYNNNTSKKYTVSANTKVYYAAATGENKVTLEEIAGGVPANTAVILHKTDAAGAAATITLTETATDITAPVSNELQVSTAGQNLGKVYRLGYKSTDGVGFYTYTTTSAPAGIIYVSSVSGANFLSLDFGEGEGDVTSISEIEKKRNAENEAFFNLAGQRVAQPTKGLYIVNGKKVIVK